MLELSSRRCGVGANSYRCRSKYGLLVSTRVAMALARLTFHEKRGEKSWAAPGRGNPRAVESKGGRPSKKRERCFIANGKNQQGVLHHSRF